VSCTSISNCFAVGSSFDKPSGTYVTLVERWNGTNWVIVPSPNPPGATYYSALYGVSCTGTTNCFAVGVSSDKNSGAVVPLIERWNGINWSIVPSPNPNPPGWGESNLNGVSCTSSTSCFAVGDTGHEPGPFVTFVERWNGTSWAIVPSPSPHPFGFTNVALNAVSCTSTTSCFVVGSGYDVFGDTEFGFVERWNGTRWTTVSNPNPTTGSVLDGVSCTSTTNCFAVGYVDLNYRTFTLVERWNGTRWAIVRSANPTGATSSALYGVSCISTRSCFAVGYSSEGTLIERQK
jgi:hypothetical protein